MARIHKGKQGDPSVAALSKIFLAVLLLTLAGVCLRCGSNPYRPTIPLVILISLDTTRADTLGCYGCDTVQTPNIDRLAQQGTRYETCYSEHPVCVPARVSLLTGLHGFKTGVLDNGQFLRPDYRDMGL